MNLDQLLNLSESVDTLTFFINLVVATILSLALRAFYVRYGQAVANRSKFATNFMPLALTTMLIITILKSSIALSLGLVGALSIVRFRAAIKDPEELIYLFLVIAIGLATGANYPLLVTVAVVLIMVLLYVNYKIAGQQVYTKENMLYVNIASTNTEVNSFVSILQEKMDFVELKRMDRNEQGIDITFICKAPNLDAITEMQDLIVQNNPQTTVSIVDQPDLIV
jgi:hypothetical protein